MMTTSVPRNPRKGLHLIRMTTPRTSGINDIKNTLDDMMSVTKDTKLPLGVKKALHDCLKCNICTTPIKAPVIAAKLYLDVKNA